MPVLYVDRNNTRLETKDGAIEIRVPGEELRRIPIHLLDGITVASHVWLESRLLTACAEHKVPITLLSRRSPGAIATVQGPPGAEARRRLRQYACYGDLAWRVRFSAILIGAKLRAQRRLLQSAAQDPNLPRQRHSCLKSAEALSALILDLGEVRHSKAAAARARVEQPATGLAEILGKEGAGASQYFAAYRELFADSLGFRSRQRRPPTDPVNVCLSLGYTLLHAEARGQIVLAGLDPFVGFLHDLEHGRESLACDLVEPLRTSVDRLVWNLFRSRTLRIEHFASAGGEGGRSIMGKAGRAIFYEQFGYLATRLRCDLRRFVQLLLRRMRAWEAAGNEIDGSTTGGSITAGPAERQTQERALQSDIEQNEDSR